MADMFVFATPKGEMHRISMANGEMKMEIKWNPGFGDKVTEAIDTVQKYIDSECLRLCDPLVPKDTGTLINSGILCTKIGSGEVIWRTPYARRWYYMPADFWEAPQRGNYWFERMKQKHRGDILKGAKARIREGMR